MSTYAPTHGKTGTAHPLDPPTPAEIEAAVAAVRADERIGEATRFWGATLDETHARAVIDGEVATPTRMITIVAMPGGGADAWEVTVELAAAADGAPTGDPGAPAADNGALRADEGARAEVDLAAAPAATATAWKSVPPNRPGITSEEARTSAQACRDDATFQAALAKRGITDPSLVMIDPESIGGFEPEQWKGRRLAWGTVWSKLGVEDNGYARPVQGVVPIIDLTTMEVLEVEDHGVVPMSEEAGPIEPGAWGPERPGLTDLEISQPDGTSFDVDGQKVTWQGWELRVGFTHREGLVLHDLTFIGRSVMRRLACNEMYVPYLDPNSTQYRKNFFDWGEYGAGPLTNSLELGCDCLGVIHYFDGTVMAGDGSARVIPSAICMHEEDYSILWKHTDMRRGVGQVRRSRRLVISCFQTVANYDYGFYWSLYQDGTIELEVKLTGMLSASGIEAGDEVPYGTIVGERVQTPYHQHYFALRVDPAVDGVRNRLVEEHAEGEPDPSLDPYGNAVRNVREPLLTESVAAQQTDPTISRHWRIESTEKENRYGEPTAYRLSLPDTIRSYCRPDSVMSTRAPFIHQHLWATRRSPDENFIGGQYPNQAEPGEEGVHVWQQQDRSLDGEEITLWPVIGSHHVPRPEQWPVMPVDRIGFKLEPDGFFDRNPTMDIADPHASCAHDENGEHSCH